MLLIKPTKIRQFMTLSYFDLTAIVAPVPPDWNGVSELKNGPLKKLLSNCY